MYIYIHIYKYTPLRETTMRGDVDGLMRCSTRRNGTECCDTQTKDRSQNWYGRANRLPAVLSYFVTF